jgi:hypothetical protein
MKAIWKDKLYVVIDTVANDIILESISDDKKFLVPLSDKTLIIDPTDDEVGAIEEPLQT